MSQSTEILSRRYLEPGFDPADLTEDERSEIESVKDSLEQFASSALSWVQSVAEGFEGFRVAS